jgi:ribosomal protein S18 acetylase RimI-like enzyme
MDALRVVSAGLPNENRPEPAEGTMSGVEIRRADTRDVASIASLERGLLRHLSHSPAFIPLVLGERRAALEDKLGDPKCALWVASQSGEAVAYLRFEPSENLVLPTSSQTTVSITGAYTREDLRGVGIGTALLQTGLQWAGSSGYTQCSVDFESANLVGSAFWLRQFEPVTHSVVRRVDSRLAWANAQRDEIDLRRSFEGHAWIG